jgi:hypothetical protein
MGNKNRQPRQVVKSQGEAERANVASQLASKGKQDFEGVYGSTTPASFDVAADMAVMADVGIVDKEHGDPSLSQIPESAPLPPQAAPQAAPVAPESQPNPELVDTEKQEEEGGLQLTDDPKENCRIVSETIGKMVPNPPSPEQLYAWKQGHGDIFLLNIGEKVFVYRYLKRQEWMQMNSNPQFANMTELQIEDMIFNKCVLWPNIDTISAAALPANTVGMIVQQIRIQSYFLDPAYVATLTIKI